MIAFVARGELATARTGRLLMVAVIKSPLRFREVLDIDNPLGGVWHVTARSIHRWLLWKKVRSGSIKGSACPVHIEIRSLTTVSKSTLIFRMGGLSFCRVGVGNSKFTRYLTALP